MKVLRRSLGRSLLASALIVAGSGCGSSAEQSGGASSQTSQVAATARAALEKQSQPVRSVPAPGPALDASSLRGKTVYYVPLVLKASYFQIVNKVATDALRRAGVTVRACDGHANPSGVGACLDQAVTRRADAVITDYIPYEMAPTAFDRVRRAGVPMYVGAQRAPDGLKASSTLRFENPDAYQSASMEGIVNAVIADSDAKARILLVRSEDDPAVARAGDHLIEYAERTCPDCELTVVRGSLAAMDKLPSLVSSSLVKDPSITYVLPQYDVFLGPAIAGVQSAGKVRDVELATANATMASLPQVKSNEQVIAAVGLDPVYSGWKMGDAALRLLAGEDPPQTYPVPVRAFTKENVDDLALTSEAEASGEWFGDAVSYQSGFEKLWGLR